MSDLPARDEVEVDVEVRHVTCPERADHDGRGEQ